MARPTYTARVIVVRKTKLGESDLILTLLAEDGSQLRAVAKGARKPKSSFASRLELFSVADVLCAKGRSLDVVSEARLVEGNAALRGDIELTSAAAPIAELVERVLFGSDFPMWNPEDEIRQVRELGLSQYEFEHLTWHNAETFLGTKIG